MNVNFRKMTEADRDEIQYSDVIFRLEVEKENFPAVHLYEKAGYQILPYLEMKK